MVQIKPSVIADLVAFQKRVGLILKVPKSIEFDLPQSEGDKIKWLLNSDRTRDFLKFTTDMKLRVRGAFEKELRKILKAKGGDFDKPWMEAGLQVLRLVVDRINAGDGGDVSMRGLKANTIARKRALKRRRPTAIGYDTGDLLNALKAGIAARAVNLVR